MRKQKVLFILPLLASTHSTSSEHISPICPGNYDLDNSGNLRPSPLGVVGRGRSRGSKLAVLQQSLHGKEVSFVSRIKSACLDLYVYESFMSYEILGLCKLSWCYMYISIVYTCIMVYCYHFCTCTCESMHFVVGIHSSVTLLCVCIAPRCVSRVRPCAGCG